MKCRNLFSWKNKENILNVLSAELSQRVVMVKVPITTAADDILKYICTFFFMLFLEKISCVFSVNCLLGWYFYKNM